ncbi:MAG: serine/threonine-protein phosphatase, partial [Thermoleophilia bacterium]|nr:serine/threonine-protein phosphatase [Thermoleophilia bacterium]
MLTAFLALLHAEPALAHADLVKSELAGRPSPAGSPAEMVTSLNRALNVVCPSNRFVTFFLCEIDPQSGDMSFSNAGHNPPFLVRADGAVE